ncbi:adhesion G-protein coupled receptor G6 isoform X2 [Dunckerocampus dactyliophorus]|uniref:adhesion G-protein coupled receptor G6 isoform X2 n=1 Tax=Dunckerocampus dactyliophorus TaxID=161453 RepID=UPI002405A4B5|nr:adhesion G-protein coupled receptor G6 isoform X2 [Dunckerocampus dactyliophorus]
MLLQRAYDTEWTAFVYKAPGSRQVELGLAGTGAQLLVWLFGQEWHLDLEVKVHQWYPICITWSGGYQRLRLYINGTMHSANATEQQQHLAQNGTLTLGVSHYVDANGAVQVENGKNLLGEISQFRMWAREWSEEELRRRKCADGDVVRWDLRQWKHDCPPQPDDKLRCESLPAMTLTPPTVSPEVGPTQRVPAHLPNMSTTGEPLDLNLTAVQADVFLRVNLSLIMTGNHTKPEPIIEEWLREKLETTGTTLVLNLIVVQVDDCSRYSCAFHVQDYSTKTIEEIIIFVNATLMAAHENGSIVIETTHVKIKRILPQNCVEQITPTIYGEYFWPETFPQVIQVMGCRKPNWQRAFRLCKLHIETDATSWSDPDMTNCSPMSIPDLENITVTTDNADEVVGIIEDMVNVQLANTTLIPPAELSTVVEKLNQVVDVGAAQPAVSNKVFHIFANILISETDVTLVAGSILTMTDRMGNTMDFPGELLSLTAPSLALSMIDVHLDRFGGLTFGVSSLTSFQEPNVFVNQSFEGKPISGANVTISLPSALQNFLPPGERNKTRIQFQFYGTQDLFQDPQTTSTSTHSGLSLNSYIVSASINGSHVSNLNDGDRVVVTLRHPKAKQPDDKVLCVFWDFQHNGGQGGWSSMGCETRSISPYQTSCLCEHLTHFAVLLDVSREPISEADSQILTVISYMGCGLSSIFLGITLLTYLAFGKLRGDYPSKILINLSAALLGLSMFFLLDSWLSSFSNYSLCIVTAAVLHYFLLASFAWMGLEAVHMYFALVKVFNTYVPSYILKFCVVGWGVPLLLVCLVLAIDKDAYGSTAPTQSAMALHSTDPFCWLQNHIFFYVTVVAFVLLILLGNTFVFVLVLVQIRRMGAKKTSVNSRGTLQDLRAVASLTVLLGLTWLMGFFSFGPGRVVMMYLFTICNTLQGFLVFLFHCLMKENVRKQWRMHVCCGALRLSEHSDWSRTMMPGGRCTKDHLINTDSVNTSSLRNISESSTESNSHKAAFPD